MQILNFILQDIADHFINIYNNPFSLFFNSLVALSIFIFWLSIYFEGLRKFLVRIYFLEKKENPKGFFLLLLFMYIFMKLTQIFIFQIFTVDGPSMSPSFKTGNIVVVDRLSSTIMSTEYTRGSVMVFNFKKKGNFADGRFLLKRLIGLPGDTIIIEDNKLKIIDKEGKVLIPTESLIKFNSKVIPNMVIKVQQDQYFFMGDNRDESYDSRYFGTINKRDISGEAVFMIYPSLKFYPFKSFDY